MSLDPIHLALDVTAVPSEPVGAGRYTIELARALAREAELSTTLIARRADTPRWRKIVETGGEGLHLLATAPRSRPLRLAYGEIGMAAQVRRTRPPIDLFHGPHYQIPARLGRPSVVTVHDLTLVEHPEWHERSKVLYFSRAMRQSALRADVVICVSEYTRDRYLAHFRPRGEVLVVHHGIDHARFHPEASAADRAILAGLGVEAPYLLHVGTIEPRKNIARLICAFDRLADDDAELRLVLAGQLAWGAEELAATLAQAQHRRRIIQLGYVPGESVAPLLRHAEVVAYPSIEEGFGLPALEALACGTPLVTTRDSVMAELAGEAATLVDPFDVDALASAIEAARKDGPERERRRRLGCTRAQEFTWERCAQGHLNSYRRALGQ